jgi:hypothetical protein
MKHMQQTSKTSETIETYYYKNLNRDGQKGLTETVSATASVERSRLIMTLTEALALLISVNRIKNKKRKTRG